jgi:hypothetical protein
MGCFAGAELGHLKCHQRDDPPPISVTGSNDFQGTPLDGNALETEGTGLCLTRASDLNCTGLRPLVKATAITTIGDHERPLLMCRAFSDVRQPGTEAEESNEALTSELAFQLRFVKPLQDRF